MDYAGYYGRRCNDECGAKTKIGGGADARSGGDYEAPETAFIVLLKENSTENIGVGGTLLADKKK